MTNKPTNPKSLDRRTRPDLTKTTTWKLVGPLFWILAGILFFINYNWIAGALAMLMLVLCTKYQS